MVLATLIDGPMRALNLMVRDGSKNRSLRLGTVGQSIDFCSVVIALGSTSTSNLVVNTDQVSLQKLDALIFDSLITIEVADGVVATI